MEIDVKSGGTECSGSRFCLSLQGECLGFFSDQDESEDFGWVVFS